MPLDWVPDIVPRYIPSATRRSDSVRGVSKTLGIHTKAFTRNEWTSKMIRWSEPGKGHPLLSECFWTDLVVTVLQQDKWVYSKSLGPNQNVGWHWGCTGEQCRGLKIEAYMVYTSNYTSPRFKITVFIYKSIYILVNHCTGIIYHTQILGRSQIVTSLRKIYIPM